MKSIITAIFLICLSLSSTTDAQIKLKFPKLPKVPNPTDQSGSATGGGQNIPSGLPSKGSNRQFVIDDGFTFFDAEPVDEYSAPLARKVGIGWHLRSSLRMMGSVPNRSGFSVVVSKGGKQLTKIRCEATAYRKAENPVPEYRNTPEDDYLMTAQNGCANMAKIIKDTGKMDVQVYYFDGDTDQEKLLRTYKIDVHEAKRVRGLATKPVEDVPHYYIQRHAETAAAILFLKPERSPNYLRMPGDSDSDSQVEVYFSISPKRQVDRLRSASTRCTVNGSPLRFPGNSARSDLADFRSMRFETAIYTDRIGAAYKKANEYMDEVSFSQYRVRLPLKLNDDPQNNRLGLLNNKGDWVCSIRIDGEPLRTFKWTIGSNGMPVMHAEQSSGNINLYHNAYLIEAEVPEGGNVYDHRLAPMPESGFFYGIPWKSAEGKAAAAKVPTKGNPYHVPSK